jgi:uncharacterized protein
MSEANSFLGRGWSFPPTFDRNTRQVVMLDGEADIKSSLQVLLSTAIGERIMQPKYGCNMDDLVFETLDTSLKTEIKNRIEIATLFFEPRINLEKTELIQSETGGMILVSIDYVVVTTNTRYNLVFPFYLSEGNK